MWVIRVLPGIAGALGAAAVAAMIVHIIVDSGLGTFWGGAIPGTVEIVGSWWLVMIAFLPLARAERSGDILTAPVLYERIHPRVQRVWSITAVLITAVLAALITWYAWLEAVEMLRIEETAGAMRTVVWPMRFVVPIGTGLWVLQLGVRLVRLRRPGTPPEPDGADERAEGPDEGERRSDGTTGRARDGSVPGEDVTR